MLLLSSKAKKEIFFFSYKTGVYKMFNTDTCIVESIIFGNIPKAIVLINKGNNIKNSLLFISWIKLIFSSFLDDKSNPFCFQPKHDRREHYSTAKTG